MQHCMVANFDTSLTNAIITEKSAASADVAQRTKFAEKVHKPPLWNYVINFKLDGFNASIWVP